MDPNYFCEIIIISMESLRFQKQIADLLKTILTEINTICIESYIFLLNQYFLCNLIKN